MSYEIKKVANGYFVHPSRDYSRNGETYGENVYVFETWERCAEWLRAQFVKVSGG